MRPKTSRNHRGLHRGLVMLMAGCTILGLVATGGCPQPPIPEPPPGRQVLVFEEVASPEDLSSVTLNSTDQNPAVGDVVVGTRGGGLLRRVNGVSTNPDGSTSVKTAPITIAEAVQDGDFTFTDGPSTAKQLATAKTFQVLNFSADLDRTLYDRGGLTIHTDGDFNFDVTLDLDIEVRSARIRYFKSAIEGTADLQLDGDVDALAGLVAETGDIALWSGSKYLYGYIGVFPFGVPVVIEAKAELVAGGVVEAVGHGTLQSGVSADSFVRVGAEYRRESGWSGLSDQGLSFDYDAPVWCLEGELGARVYVRPTIELMLYKVAGPYFDIEPYLEYTAAAYACGGGGQSPTGAYDWELVGGAAAHAKVKVDILDLYMIESPTITVFDVRRTLAEGHGDGSLDSDGDGVPDNQDGCPNDPNKTSPGNCGCGQPETPGCGAPNCDAPAGQQCPIDYEAEMAMAIIEHGPGPCENTGSEPGPSLEYYDVAMPATVAPGQQVTFRIDWNRCSDCNPNAVIYTSLIGDWAPADPLYVSSAYFTSCGETARDTVTFTAPSGLGRYRIRWMLCMAFEPMEQFCGNDYEGTAWDVGVCPYVEVSFSVCE
ncbi:MAG: hypothetical protein GF341_03120 [candidate division Zixibacteria bacterium]|nr:hypothetical protein [candidate division Zixibacteria bacterium]